MHIPKTAGNALQNTLSRYSEDTVVTTGGKDGVERFGMRSASGTFKHSTLTEYLAALGLKKFRSKKKFTCVRNPWDRAVSFYFSPHKRRDAWNRDEFIRSLDDVFPMVAFLRLPGDRPGTSPSANLDFIIRYENLDNDFDDLCDFLGFPRQILSIRNQTSRLPYPDYYDPELVRIVGDRFREDAEMFGYEFNRPVVNSK